MSIILTKILQNIAMTFEPYSPDKLDQFVLRLVDLSASLRKMALDARNEGLQSVPIHDKKALEWLLNLERWSQKSRTNLDIAILDSKHAQSPI